MNCVVLTHYSPNSSQIHSYLLTSPPSTPFLPTSCLLWFFHLITNRVTCVAHKLIGTGPSLTVWSATRSHTLKELFLPRSQSKTHTSSARDGALWAPPPSTQEYVFCFYFLIFCILGLAKKITLPGSLLPRVNWVHQFLALFLRFFFFFLRIKLNRQGSEW